MEEEDERMKKDEEHGDALFDPVDMQNLKEPMWQTIIFLRD
jgi:hypothetical protein